MSFGGVSGGKDGGIRALVKGGIQEACLFQDENDIDRAVVPNAIKDKSVIMARPDVLVQKQNSFEEIKTRLTELEQDDQRKLTIDRDVESEIVFDTPAVEVVMSTPEIDSDVEVDHGFSL